MRKIQLLAGLLLLSGTMFISSCKKDSTTTDLSPSMNFVGGNNFISSDQTVDAGTVFSVGVNATANSTSGTKLTKFKIVRTFNNVPQTAFDTTFNSSISNYNENFTAVAAPVAGSERWTFTITDKDGETKELAFVITTVATAGPIDTYTAVLLGGQQNPNLGSFYATTNTVFNEANANQNQNKIDMVFYYGTSNHASIVAPASTQLSLINEFKYILDQTDANHWTVTNETKFKDVTSAVSDWALVTNDALITANAANLTALNVNLLTVNNIIAFETAATSANPGKKGLFKVLALGGTTGADRSITIEVKIQQ
jgi:hypothetical protein